MTICVKIAIFMRGGNGENTHGYLLRTAGAFSASLYDLCKENKQRAEGGPLQELAFSMVTPLSGPRPAWWSLAGTGVCCGGSCFQRAQYSRRSESGRSQPPHW